MSVTSLTSRRRLIALLTVTFCLLGCQSFAARNVILLIGDGTSYQQLNAGRYYLGGSTGKLSFDSYYKCGVTTRALNAAITDSAAAASALATGHKVNNNAISTSPTGQQYQTILEVAKSLGKRTGLVTTDPITRATPAAFGAHDPSRYNYLAIGDDYLNQTTPNVIFGGGATSTGGGEFFSNAQVATANALGYQTVYNASQMNALNAATVDKALGLFSLNEMPYEYDGYPSTTPHLSQMTSKALDILNADQDGFFLMVEGAKVDWAAHANDIVRTTKEVVELNNTAQAILNWMQGRDDTLLIITGDHETGGLTVANRGQGRYATPTWTSTDHTATNVPLYMAGVQTDLVNSYITNGVVDNTDIFRIMNTALTTPVPEPASILTMLCGFAGTGVLAIKRKRR